MKFNYPAGGSFLSSLNVSPDDDDLDLSLKFCALVVYRNYREICKRAGEPMELRLPKNLKEVMLMQEATEDIRKAKRTGTEKRMISLSRKLGVYPSKG